SILLGNANGTFQSAVNFPVGSFPISVAVGDFNGDGKLDLSTANTGSHNVSILLGNCVRVCETGAFAPADNYGAGTSARSVAVGDFNRDGKQDLIVTNSNTANVSILLG